MERIRLLSCLLQLVCENLIVFMESETKKTATKIEEKLVGEITAQNSGQQQKKKSTLTYNKRHRGEAVGSWLNLIFFSDSEAIFT